MRLFVTGLLALILSSGCLITQRVEAAAPSDEWLTNTVYQGDVGEVDSILQLGRFYTTIYGRNQALTIAAQKGHAELVSKLLEHDADVNCVNKYGDTPLAWAAYEGHTKIVSMLLQSGANVNGATSCGDTPLTWATRNGHTEIVSKLLYCGANINHANNAGDTALTLAAYNGHTEIVSKLLQSGASVSQVNKYGDTAATLAFKNGMGRSPEVVNNIICKLKKYEKIQKRNNRALIKEFDKLPPEMRVEIMNYMHGSDEIDQLAKTLKSKLTAEQMMLLYLFKKDARPVIKKLKDDKPNAMQLDFIGLPAQLQEAIIKKYDAELYNRLMERQPAIAT